MFDANFFRTHLVSQVEALGTGVTTAKLHLYNGEILAIREVISVEDEYVLLEVLSTDEPHEEAKRQRTTYMRDEVSWDRVAVAYESITHVVLTIKEPEHPAKIGFKST